jgi:hypothetical protein
VAALMIYASGYHHPYPTDRAEIASANAGTWFPSSVDFRATAGKSGNAAGAASLADMLKIIGAQRAGSIAFLGLIGHGASRIGMARTFGFSGRISVSPAQVVLTPSGFLNANTIWTNYDAIRALRGQFAADAKIVVYACDSGMDTTLLAPISNAFGVCAYGFKQQVTWCFNHSAQRVSPGTRGRVFVDRSGLLGMGMIPCDGFSTDAKTLTPDVNSCIGKTSTTKPLLPDMSWA